MMMSSKRQRFFVELLENEVTVISWKKLLAEADRIVVDTVIGALPELTPSVAAPAPGLNADGRKKSLKLRRKLKLEDGEGADERKLIKAVKHENIVKPPIIKGKGRRTVRSHNNISGGAKLKQTSRACFSCSEKIINKS